MTTTYRKLALFAAAALVLIYVGWDMLAGISASPASPSIEPLATPPASASPVAPTALATPDPAVASSRRSYALALADLPGLSPTTPPGTRLQIWGGWEPPLVKEPAVRKLLDDVILEEIAPPVTPEGPYVAILSIEPKQLKLLVYGDRYLSLSAAIVSPL